MVSGQWNHCDSRIRNAGVMLRAQEQQLQINEATRLNKAADRRSEMQHKARAAQVKYEFNQCAVSY